MMGCASTFSMQRSAATTPSAMPRPTPAGIAVLAMALCLLAAGFVFGGAYLALARADTGWVAWAAALVVGPLLIYVALHLVLLTRWAWLVMVLLLGLLLTSSIIRAAREPGIPVAPGVEVVIELGLLGYLFRRSVRQAFGRTG
jgi:hypothetical protein